MMNMMSMLLIVEDGMLELCARDMILKGPFFADRFVSWMKERTTNEASMRGFLEASEYHGNHGWLRINKIRN